MADKLISALTSAASAANADELVLNQDAGGGTFNTKRIAVSAFKSSLSLYTVGGALGTPSSGNGSNITNVNAASLGGATFAAPGAIGSGTPGTGAFTTLSANAGLSVLGTTNPGQPSSSTSGVFAYVGGSTTPQIWMTNSGAGSDAKSWYWGVSTSGTISLNAVNDARNSSATPFSFTRAGTTIDAATLAATTINLTGNVVPTTIHGLKAPTHKFWAYKSSNSTNAIGNNTARTLVFDTEVFDIGGMYNNSTGVATMPGNGTLNFFYKAGVFDSGGTWSWLWSYLSGSTFGTHGTGLFTPAGGFGNQEYSYAGSVKVVSSETVRVQDRTRTGAGTQTGTLYGSGSNYTMWYAEFIPD